MINLYLSGQDKQVAPALATHFQNIFKFKIFKISAYIPSTTSSPAFPPISSTAHSSSTPRKCIRSPTGSQQSMAIKFGQDQAPPCFIKAKNVIPSQGMGSNKPTYVPDVDPNSFARCLTHSPSITTVSHTWGAYFGTMEAPQLSVLSC